MFSNSQSYIQQHKHLIMDTQQQSTTNSSSSVLATVDRLHNRMTRRKGAMVTMAIRKYIWIESTRRAECQRMTTVVCQTAVIDVTSVLVSRFTDFLRTKAWLALSSAMSGNTSESPRLRLFAARTSWQHTFPLAHDKEAAK